VLFGTVAASTFTENSDTQITITSPAGTVDVTVTTPGGLSAITPADLFKFSG
jgi:large repetitive protein